MSDASSTHQAQIMPASASNGTVPLTSAQQRLWFLDQWMPNSPVYTIPEALRLTGSLDLRALFASLARIVQRHEALRTSFPTHDGRPVQHIAPRLSLPLPLLDLQTLPEAERPAHANQLAIAAARQPFDLARGPLVRALLLRLAPEQHLLLLALHHSIADGWSLDILLRELADCYNAYHQHQTDSLPPLPVQYADFALWQRAWLEGAGDHTGSPLQAQLAYWRQQLADLPILDLPTDRPRPAIQSQRGALLSFQIDHERAEALRAFGKRSGVTLFMTLLTAFDVLLARYSGQYDIVVGSPIANRTRVELEDLIGFFVNTLVLRTDLSDQPRVSDLLARVRQVCLEAYEHQDMPFERLVEELRPERSLSHTPLVQVVLALQPGAREPALVGMAAQRATLDLGTARFDLAVLLEETPDGISGQVEYATDLFEATTIRRLLGHFQTLLKAMLLQPQRHISQLPLLTAPERQQLLVEYNDSQADFPRQHTFPELFATQVAHSPDALAALCDLRPTTAAQPTSFAVEQLTYAALAARATRLAHFLRSRGVGPDTLVALCLERSLDVLVGILAIHNAGAAYLPLDPAYPPERLAFMLQDTQAPLVLTQAALLPRLPLPPERLFCLDRDWPSLPPAPPDPLSTRALPDHLAYLIYTSGSTGRPKGVMVRHAGLLNLCYGLRACFSDPSVQHTALIASINFDVSVNQIFPTLLFGRTLHIIPDPIKYDSAALSRYLHQAQIDLLDAVPSYLQAVLAELAPAPLPNRLRYLLIGGEKLEARLVEAAFKQLGEQLTLVNIYGLTELTDINAFACISADERGSPISIGWPLQNNRLYLTDRAGQLVPLGVVGEVCIGGESEARGYLNRPELTAEKFNPNPFATTEDERRKTKDEDSDPSFVLRPSSFVRLYKTGDLGRRRADGRIEILGRLDQQVKLRGYRIEVGEIEALLAQHVGVREAVVIARHDTPGDTRLVAYIVPEAGQAPSVEELRGFLKRHLPEYMVPVAFVFLDALPQTPNNKVDRKALPAPEQTASGSSAAYVPPRTPLEAVLAGIWIEVLGVEQPGIHDTFFTLGGHSLLATQVVSRINQVFRVDLPVRTLFEAPTLAELASHMIANEARPGVTEKTAEILQRIKRMSPEAMRQALQQKRSSEAPA